MTSVKREELIRALPYARRYARALTGTQERGDELVADSVKSLLESSASDDGDVRFALYQRLTEAFGAGFPQAAALDAAIGRQDRQLLLLTSLEEMSVSRAAAIVGLPEREAEQRLVGARERLRAAAATDVLIIEDEAIIAMDLEEVVEGCGHRVIGVAATEQEAVAVAQRERPGLILADVNLGPGGDGINAVARILRTHHVPVIFVTAYPERVLTGEAVEPTYVITKPFDPLQLAITTYQAVKGGATLE
ncbi:MAG: response regulator [Acetobacteraceae bacterium]|nr:response regulator [Acetobacteraceae bacterium]